MAATVWQLQHLGTSIKCRYGNYEEISHGRLYTTLFCMLERENKLKAASINHQNNLLLWAVLSIVATC